MKNLQEATERICELKGSLVALDALNSALLQQLPLAQRDALLRSLLLNAEVARTVLLHSPVSDLTVNAFDHDVARMSNLLRSEAVPG
jgi:hypothetical protein